MASWPPVSIGQEVREPLAAPWEPIRCPGSSPAIACSAAVGRSAVTVAESRANLRCWPGNTSKAAERRDARPPVGGPSRHRPPSSAQAGWQDHNLLIKKQNILPDRRHLSPSAGRILPSSPWSDYVKYAIPTTRTGMATAPCLSRRDIAAALGCGRDDAARQRRCA